MPRHTRGPSRRDDLGAAERRLLRSLASSLRAGGRRPETHPAAASARPGPQARAAQALVDLGLAAWIDEGGTSALRLTEDGRLRARRDEARGVHGGDLAFLAQHGGIVREGEGGGGPVLRDAAESPLSWLRGRRNRDGDALIDDARFLAGERLRADMTRGAMLARVTADWSAVGRSGAARGPAEATDAALAARQRVGRALDAVGNDLSGLLVDVCGYLKGLEQVERERGWPARSAKVVLSLALGRLADHYGYHAEARGPARSGAIRSWVAGPDGGEPATPPAGPPARRT